MWSGRQRFEPAELQEHRVASKAHHHGLKLKNRRLLPIFLLRILNFSELIRRQLVLPSQIQLLRHSSLELIYGFEVLEILVHLLQDHLLVHRLIQRAVVFDLRLINYVGFCQCVLFLIAEFIVEEVVDFGVI